jgi:hypothetical protein
MHSIAGLAQVISACKLITKSRMTSVTVSIASGPRDSELIDLAREAAEECGVSVDYERTGRMLVLRFTREGK